jgi:hypothetical protein
VTGKALKHEVRKAVSDGKGALPSIVSAQITP